MIGLTATQARALDLVRDYIASEGVAPSLADIQAGLGLASKSNVHRLLVALEERGHIRRLYGRARSIEVIDPTAGLDSLSREQLLVMRRRIDLILRGMAC